MRNFQYLFLFLSFSLVIAGCARLDDNLFNNNEHKIDEYKLHAYTGEVDFRLDASFDIPASKIHLITLQSQAADEATPTKIYAVYIGELARIATDTVIMYCHGNKDHLDFYWPRAQLLANVNGKNNYGVLMVDYRGYGLSEGKPSEKGLYADAQAGLQWLATNGLTSNRLVMYGFSMGSAPATKLTAEPVVLTPSKLILEAPIASVKVMVQDGSGLALPASFVTDLKIDNAELMKKVQQPFLWIHGINDDFLNVTTHGQLIFDNYKGVYKESFLVPGANHSDIQTTVGFATYMQRVGSFIRR